MSSQNKPQRNGLRKENHKSTRNPEAMKEVNQDKTPTGFFKYKFIVYSLILAFLGFMVSLYLTILHYKNIIPPCNANFGCETVLTSKYSMVGPVPVAVLGILFFLALMFLCLMLITNYKKTILDLFYALTAVGLVVSFVLIYIQANLIHAFCQYCLFCESSSIGIALLAYFNFREDKKS